MTLELTRMKRIARTSLASLFLVVVCLAITGALYEVIGRWRDKRHFLSVATLFKLVRSA